MFHLTRVYTDKGGIPQKIIRDERRRGGARFALTPPAKLEAALNFLGQVGRVTDVIGWCHC